MDTVETVGLKCPECGRLLARVLRTLKCAGAIHRDRQCQWCSRTYVSRETLMTDQPRSRPAHAQGIVYEMLFHSRQATILQLSRLTGLSYARTCDALQRLCDSGLAASERPGLYVLIEVKDQRA